MPLSRDEVLAILRVHEAALRKRGVVHAALFGSVARGDAHAGSDIDILIELEKDDQRTLFGYAGIKRRVAELLPGRVDVVDIRRLKPDLAGPVATDVIYAF